ncbi:hypothetical protein E6Q11_00940 [Candidatus Dojkabacteria bacterium]|uniref:Uncharacterized protein n=1 Tax=Candidatus Dojkabacteria bacterium TaxID=2099670 RepID=A0A5C7JAF3_9BACT|nr:MAG: hypothetical protein E6Q11_00940 [Candidatus Dojkabacteria bacterium]
MATYTDYLDDDTGNNCYVKPEPLTVSPWSTGVVNATENGTTGSYAVTLDSSLSYVAFRRAGASPASSDQKLGRFPKLDATASANIATSTTIVESQ